MWYDGNSRNFDHHMLMHANAVPRTDSYISFLTNKCVNLWNSLPYSIRELVNEDTDNNSVFKSEVKEHMFNVLENKFIHDDQCTWVLVCRCSKCINT